MAASTQGALRLGLREGDNPAVAATQGGGATPCRSLTPVRFTYSPAHPQRLLRPRGAGAYCRKGSGFIIGALLGNDHDGDRNQTKGTCSPAKAGGIRDWATKYKDDGLVVIGVHTPEFAFEKHGNKVRRAVAELGVSWPVKLDSDYATWKRFSNDGWPGFYFIDAKGQVRHHRLGEGEATTAAERVLVLRDASQFLSCGAAGRRIGASATRIIDYGGADLANETFHAKIVLADGVAVYVGSANLLKRSKSTNLECGMLVEGPAVGAVKVLLDAVTAIAER